MLGCGSVLLRAFAEYPHGPADAELCGAGSLQRERY